MRRINPHMVCEKGQCENTATHMVYSRRAGKVLVCCEAHADFVADESGPEYTHTCENCGCILPIN